MKMTSNPEVPHFLRAPYVRARREAERRASIAHFAKSCAKLGAVAALVLGRSPIADAGQNFYRQIFPPRPAAQVEQQQTVLPPEALDEMVIEQPVGDITDNLAPAQPEKPIPAQKPEPKKENIEIKYGRYSYEGPDDEIAQLFRNFSVRPETWVNASREFDIPLHYLLAQGHRESHLQHYTDGRVTTGAAGDYGVLQITKPAYDEISRFYHLKPGKSRWENEIHNKVMDAFPNGLPSWEQTKTNPHSNIRMGAAYDFICARYTEKDIGKSTGKKPSDQKFWRITQDRYNQGPGFDGAQPHYSGYIMDRAAEIRERCRF